MIKRSNTFACFWPLVVVVLMLTLSAAPASAGRVWLKATVGSSGMAMDDINNATYRFYDTSVNGYNLPDLESGLNLSFHLGNFAVP